MEFYNCVTLQAAKYCAAQVKAHSCLNGVTGLHLSHAMCIQLLFLVSCFFAICA